jgi:hypothetical protein
MVRMYHHFKASNRNSGQRSNWLKVSVKESKLATRNVGDGTHGAYCPLQCVMVEGVSSSFLRQSIQQQCW